MATKRTAGNRGISLVKKSNQLIEARYKFDVWETRFFLALLSHIRREDEDFKPYRIWYRDLIKTFGLKSNQSYDLLREAARSLMQKSFKVTNVTESGIKRDKEYHIVRTVDYMAEGEEHKVGAAQEEFIDVTFEPEMRPLLLQLQKNFTAYDLRNVVKLGTYPIRIYELLKQYESIGHRTLGFEEMKRMFELENEYPLFANFFQRIIEPSIRDINEYTDLRVTNTEKIKHGKKVVSVKFIFEAKTEADLRRLRGEVAAPPPVEEEKAPKRQAAKQAATTAEKDHLIKTLFDEVVHKLGVTPSVFLDLLDHHTEEQIRQAMRVTRRARMNNQIKTNEAGFFVQALKAGYTDPKEEAARRKAAEAAQKAKEEAVKIRLLELEKEKSAAINDRIRQLTNSDATVTDRAIESLRQSPLVQPVIERMQETLQRPLVVEDYRQDALLREMVKRAIMELNRSQFADLFALFEHKSREISEASTE